MDFNTNLNDLSDRAKDVDPDIRFMAVSDIDKMLCGHKNQLASNSYKLKNVAILLCQLLQDSNPDVQNQAVKTFQSLGAVFNESHIHLLDVTIGTVFDMVQKDQSTRKDNEMVMASSNYTMALRYFIQNLNYSKQSAAEAVVSRIFPSIVNNHTQVIQSLDYIEILSDLIKYNGFALDGPRIKQALILLINSSYKCYGILSTKSISTLSLLMSYSTTAAQAENIVDRAFLDAGGIQSINPSLDQFQLETVRLNIMLNLSKTKNSEKFVSRFDSIFEVLKDDLFLDRFEDVEMDDEDNEINDDIAKFDELRDVSLSCIENLLSLFYKNFNNHNESILAITKLFLKYDPFNFGDDDDEEEEADTMDEDEDEIDFSDDDEYEDDGGNDDISWRLRKQSAKLIGILVKKSRGVILHALFDERHFDLLVTKLNDSNDLVVSEVLCTLTIIIQQIHELGDSDKELYGKLINKLEYVVKSITKNLAKSKNVNSLNNYLSFVSKLLDVSKSYFTSNFILSILSAIQSFKASSASNFQLDTDLIDLYTGLFQQHNLVGLKSKLDSIISDLVVGISSNARNASLASINSSIYLVQNMTKHHIDYSEFPSFNSVLSLAIEKSGSKKFDSELREKCSTFLIAVYKGFRLDDSSISEQILAVIKTNLTYDSLSEPTLVSIGKLFGFDVTVNDIPSYWLVEVIDISLKFISSNNQVNQPSLHKEALELIVKIIKSSQLENKLDHDIYVRIIESLISKQFIDIKQYENKLLAIGILLSKITQCNISLVEQIVMLIQDGISSKIEDDYPLILITKHLTHKVDGEKLYDELFNKDSFDKPILSPAILSTVVVESHLHHKIAEFEKLLMCGVSDEKQLIFILNFLGNVSKFKKLEIELSVFLELLRTYQSNETVKLTIAGNIGKFISRDINSYLPHILKSLKSASENEAEETKSLRYCLLLALRQELDIKYRDFEHNRLNSKAHNNIVNESSASSIWKVVEEIESKEELSVTELGVASEILTLIVLAREDFIGNFQRYLDAEEAQWNYLSMNYLLLSAIKQLISQEYFSDDTKKQFLRGDNFVRFVNSCLNSSSLDLKQMSLNLLLSVFRIDFDEYFNRRIIQTNILMNILVELKPRTEFIKKIQIGPFKTKIDDGIELRKSVYELLFAILGNDLFIKSIGEDAANSSKGMLESILQNIVDFGLKDISEIILIANLMIQNILKISKYAIFADPAVFDNFMTRSNKLLNKKLNDKSTKQQVEEQKESVKYMSKTIKQLDSIIEHADSDEVSGTLVGKWREFERDNVQAFQV
ncbi:hypothetical protein DASC09_003140 [Saccharomycopsis crataegensis]|uniref:TATA-binding protein interacting (TIP20) domain-containing protein n=1 Tax=Saccharomycopsis crataegensis TaxID=43959 RepID=A0AAV5QE80_9ASCO|nr:hypothetical protein DASC09_003140 [Saccharomycopsis crataegensis]